MNKTTMNVIAIAVASVVVTGYLKIENLKDQCKVHKAINTELMKKNEMTA